MTEHEKRSYNINVTVSLQEKGGIYQAVLSYKDLTNKWKTVWRSTHLKVKNGTKKLAKQKAIEIKENFEKELFNNIRSNKTGIEAQLDMEFIDFMLMRLEEVNVKRKYEYSTYVGYKSNIDIHMTPFFGSSKSNNINQHIYKVYEITPDLIDSFFTHLSVDCKLKNTSIKHFKNQISTAFDLLDSRNIMRKPTIGIEHLKDEVYISQTYSMKELNQLLDIVKDDTIEIPILLASYYGLRRSEVVGLKWSAINFEENTLTVNHTVVQVSGHSNSNIKGKLIAKDRTKTIQSNRTLPLYGDIKKALLEKQKRIILNKQLFKKSYNNKYEDYVCIKDNGDLINPDYITHKFQKIIKKHNLKKIRYHDLRHTIATELNANGVDIKSIAEFLGHCNLSTTRRYAHPDERIKQRVASTYENLIQEAKDNYNINTKNTQLKKFTVKRKIKKSIA